MNGLFNLRLPRQDGGYMVPLVPRLRRVAPPRAPDRAVELLEVLVAAAGRIERALEKPTIAARLLDRDEAAAFVGVSTRSFDRHVAPDLGRVPVGTRVLYRRDDLEQWVNARTRWPSRVA